MREIATVTVYPTKASAIKLVHPGGIPMTADGADWPRDVFTARRIADGSITKTKPVVAAPATAPAPAPVAPITVAVKPTV